MSTLFTEHAQQHSGFAPAFLRHTLKQEIEDSKAQTPMAAFDPQRSAPVFDKGAVASICRFVDSCLLQADLSPAMIARHMGMSRAKLYRLAKPLGGIQRFVRMRRLHYAAALFADDVPAAQSISRLAYDLGFGSENTFRRAFKEAFGVTPTEARAAARTQMGTH